VDIGRGLRAFEHPAVRGTWRFLAGPDDVLGLMDGGGGDGVVAAVQDAGATFLAPLYHELTAVVCLSGTPRSHIGIMAREFKLPCVVAADFPDGLPAAGAEVEVDCSGPGDGGVVRTGPATSCA
jgi:hypothetical protein